MNPVKHLKIELFPKIVNGDNFWDFGTGDEEKVRIHNQETVI